MASFPTHLVGGLVTSGAAAALLPVCGLASLPEAGALAVVGTVGSLVPDLDADNSIPSRLIRWVTALAVGGIVATAGWGIVGPAAVFLASTLAVVGSQLVLSQVVRRLTTHRGMVHSIPMAAACGLAAVIVAHRALGLDAVFAWFCGAFVTLGFLAHLVLDELSSVDLKSARIKRSAGTALKFASSRFVVGTCIAYAALAIAAYYAPSPRPFMTLVGQRLNNDALARSLGG